MLLHLELLLKCLRVGVTTFEIGKICCWRRNLLSLYLRILHQWPHLLLLLLRHVLHRVKNRLLEILWIHSIHCLLIRHVRIPLHIAVLRLL